MIVAFQQYLRQPRTCTQAGGAVSGKFRARVCGSRSESRSPSKFTMPGFFSPSSLETERLKPLLSRFADLSLLNDVLGGNPMGLCVDMNLSHQGHLSRRALAVSPWSWWRADIWLYLVANYSLSREGFHPKYPFAFLPPSVCRCPSQLQWYSTT